MGQVEEGRDVPGSADYASMTPDDLRKEADRRELVERARSLAVRHDARVRLVKAIHDLDIGMVRDAGAAVILKDAVLHIVAAEKAESKITNGDVHMLSSGPSDDWWREATSAHPQREFPDLLDEIERGRKSPWPPHMDGSADVTNTHNDTPTSG